MNWFAVICVASTPFTYWVTNRLTAPTVDTPTTKVHPTNTHDQPIREAYIRPAVERREAIAGRYNPMTGMYETTYVERRFVPGNHF